MKKSIRTLLFVFILMSLVLAACGGNTAPVEEPAEPVEEPATTSDDPMAMYAPDAVSGDIVVAGSSTVFPLAERMIERFSEEGFDGNTTYDSIGSGAGFERFCVAGESDVAGASRAVKDSEVESCEAIGRTPIEFRVGTDALAVVVSNENDFVDNLSMEQLAVVFSTAETWADVRRNLPFFFPVTVPRPSTRSSSVVVIVPSSLGLEIDT